MSLTTMQIAELTHEANRAYRRLIGEDPGPSWVVAPEWQRESVIDGVRGWLGGTVRSEERSHENWLALKVAEGWRWGPEKDVRKKEHPCLMAYAELPEEQKLKDHLFSAIVLACKGSLAEGEIEA